MLVLAGSGLFVYLRLRADLDDAIDAELRARATAAVSSVARVGVAGVATTPLQIAPI